MSFASLIQTKTIFTYLLVKKYFFKCCYFLYCLYSDRYQLFHSRTKENFCDFIYLFISFLNNVVFLWCVSFLFLSKAYSLFLLYIFLSLWLFVHQLVKKYLWFWQIGCCLDSLPWKIALNQKFVLLNIFLAKVFKLLKVEKD